MTLLNLDALQSEVGAHVAARFRPDPGSAADPLADALATSEEVSEATEMLAEALAARILARLAKAQGGVCRATLKRHHGARPGTDWDAKLREETADLAITCLSLADNEGWSLADAIVDRWKEVRER